jgi:hypothetical protein
MEIPKILKIFIGFFVVLFLGSILLLLVAFTGSETLTYGLLGILIAITFAFLFSTNIFAQEK